MSTVSQRIRAAALGPVPHMAPEYAGLWLGGLGAQIVDFVDHPHSGPWLEGMTNDQRRMFLLFVAEALE